ncbi:hypothetical protein L9F63_024279 [Diploptera punctata]|uniref:Uncharacterized protein n=1 Tax=Diploptera punctata TaxID=6984 RepID=A0AAD7ZH25_DIPPU|nr:hypothetical protein L9F63_024279 [Diploptera punctata]
MDWTPLKKDLTRRRFLELHLDVVSSLPADHLAFYLNDLCETSARRIQTAWRGYRARKKFSEQKEELYREKAAVAIQRQVRHWLHSKAERQELSKQQESYLTNRINEERLQQLQQKANRWQENHDTKFPGIKQMSDTHSDVQNRLENFYWKMNEGENRHQRMSARCAQLEAISMLMKELPPLSQSEDVDLSWYHCTSLPLATAARIAHKRQLKSMNAPWWNKLKMQ